MKSLFLFLKLHLWLIHNIMNWPAICIWSKWANIFSHYGWAVKVVSTQLKQEILLCFNHISVTFEMFSQYQIRISQTKFNWKLTWIEAPPSSSPPSSSPSSSSSPHDLNSYTNIIKLYNRDLWNIICKFHDAHIKGSEWKQSEKIAFIKLSKWKIFYICLIYSDLNSI